MVVTPEWGRLEDGRGERAQEICAHIFSEDISLNTRLHLVKKKNNKIRVVFPKGTTGVQGRSGSLGSTSEGPFLHLETHPSPLASGSHPQVRCLWASHGRFVRLASVSFPLKWEWGHIHGKTHIGLNDGTGCPNVGNHSFHPDKSSNSSAHLGV